jgi:hypothetical protein
MIAVSRKEQRDAPTAFAQGLALWFHDATNTAPPPRLGADADDDPALEDLETCDGDRAEAAGEVLAEILILLRKKTEKG